MRTLRKKALCSGFGISYIVSDPIRIQKANESEFQFRFQLGFHIFDFQFCLDLSDSSFTTCVCLISFFRILLQILVFDRNL